jgi:hypothetical protein
MKLSTLSSIAYAIAVIFPLIAIFFPWTPLGRTLLVVTAIAAAFNLWFTRRELKRFSEIGEP